MLRSLYSGVSGMKNFQLKLDVIGNNIANVNTFGFKKGRATFQDMLSQNLNPAQAPGDKGGINPTQVGLGAGVGSIDTIQTQGSLQTTNRPLDLAISGDGFFVVEGPDNNFFTRAGNFYMDQAGDLVNPNGYRLLDSGEAPINIPPGAKSISITPDGSVNYIDDAGDVQTAGQIGLAIFANPGGLEKIGDNLYRDTDNTGDALIDVPGGQDGQGDLVSGALEMSNVDLSDEFTEMIVTQRGFQSNTKIISTSDEILQEIVNLKR